ncbi:MAG: hypothetical protein KGI63_14000, partial [Xanthomonadaceae bacterium]|nr:hypothetical protein [Xanthomonadaceae bacterium]
MPDIDTQIDETLWLQRWRRMCAGDSWRFEDDLRHHDDHAIPVDVSVSLDAPMDPRIAAAGESRMAHCQSAVELARQFKENGAAVPRAPARRRLAHVPSTGGGPAHRSLREGRGACP